MEDDIREIILEKHPIPIDTRGKFSNKSADLKLNQGRGKLSEDQMIERAKLHAKNQLTGSPSIAEITKHWYTSYEITMSVQSEYDWVRNNQDKINLAIAGLQNDGEMSLLTTPNAVVSTMLSDAGNSLIAAIKESKKSQNDLGKSIRELTDPYKQVGLEDKKAYFDLSDKERKSYKAKIEESISVARSQQSGYKLVSDSIVNQSKVLLDMMKTICEINKSGQAMDGKIKQGVNNEIKSIGLKQQTKIKLQSISPMDPVSDDDRDI